MRREGRHPLEGHLGSPDQVQEVGLLRVGGMDRFSYSPSFGRVVMDQVHLDRRPSGEAGRNNPALEGGISDLAGVPDHSRGLGIAGHTRAHNRRFHRHSIRSPGHLGSCRSPVVDMVQGPALGRGRGSAAAALAQCRHVVVSGTLLRKP